MEILTPLQKSFLQSFFKTYVGGKFFLGAGTALTAFYLQHRLSEDIDLFTLDQDLGFDGVDAEVFKIGRSLNLEMEHHISTPTFLQFIFETSQGETLKVDVTREIPVHFGEIKKIEGISVDSLENITVSKLLSIYGRFDGKDFVDFYLLTKEKSFDFDEVLKKVKEKYPGLNELYLAGNMADVELLPALPKMLRPFDKKGFVGFFKDLSQNLFQQLNPEK
jgi:predicted nucleotidyltransferase component of viral defense system